MVNKAFEDEPVYSNMNDPDADIEGRESRHYQEVLSEMGISSPPGFWAAIEEDRIHNIGNSLRFWSEQN